jgi:TRAP-type C4-dicarboxylate transport system substrate-binding protein
MYDKMVIQVLDQKLQEKTNGRLSLEVYYGSALAKQGECLSGIKSGTVDIGVDILTMYPGEYLYTELLGTPGINLGDAEAFTYTTLDYQKEFHEKGLDDFMVVCRFSSGAFGCLSADAPVSMVSDLKGMTVRATSNFIPWYEAMDASATFIPMGDIYESLKLSVINGAHTTISGIYAFKLYEVADYYTPFTMCGGEQVIVMSKELYDSMPADLQAAIQATSEEMVLEVINYVKAAEAQTMSEIQKENPDFKFVEIEDTQGFIDAAQPLLQAKAEELNNAGLDGTGALEWLKSKAVS